MSIDFKKVRIGDLGRVVTGKTPSTAREEYFGSNYPFITPTDIDGSKRHIETERQLSEESKKDFHNYLLPSGSVCFVCIGATIGKMCMTKVPSFTNQQINSIIVDGKKYDNRFVYYLLSTKKEHVKNIAGGAATPIVNKSAFSDVFIEVPALMIQRKIAALLSVYDDLIENNLRRIKILEEMAQSLYREWFVKLRFPGHQKVKMVNSSIGKIPEGWEVAEFGKMADLSRQSVHPQEKPEKIFVHFSIPSFDTGQLPTLEKGAEIKSLKFYVPEGCVLLSKLNPRIRRVWLPDPPDGYTAIASTEFLVLVPKAPFSREFLYSVCMTPEFTDTLAGFAGGTSTSHQRVKPEDVLRLKLPIPDAKILRPFEKIVSPMVSFSTSSLRRRNQNLRQTRDLLLPKLISGELDVSELDITIPEANA